MSPSLTVVARPVAAPEETRDPGELTSPSVPLPPAPQPPSTARRLSGGSTSRRRSRSWLWVMLALVLVGLGGTEAWRLVKAPLPPSYTTARIDRGTVSRAVTSSGTVNPIITVQVGTYVSGVITALQCDYNTRVTKGQLCAKIDPRPYQVVVDQQTANVTAAKAQLVKDQAGLAYAKLSSERDLELLKQGVISQDTADNARSAYDQARAQVGVDEGSIAQFTAALHAAQVNLGYTDIVSPVNGTVVSRNITMGQTVAASFQTPTLFLIATDLTKMEVDTNVSESDIGGIKEGDEATFTVEAYPDRQFPGVVRQVRQAPQTVQNVVTYDVVVDVANRDLALMPGMTATIRIVGERRDGVLRVPDQALRYTPGVMGASPLSVPRPAGLPSGASGGGPAQVWVLKAGRLVNVPIRTGLDDESHAEIVGGDLRPGDEVVIGEQSGKAMADRSGRPGPSLPRF